jgi:hypothetical protein
LRRAVAMLNELQDAKRPPVQLNWDTCTVVLREQGTS